MEMSSSTEPPSKRRKVASDGGIDPQLTDEDLLRWFRENLEIQKRIWMENNDQPWKDVAIPTSIGDIKSLGMADYRRNVIDTGHPHLSGLQLLRLYVNRFGGQLESIRFMKVYAACGFGIPEMTLLKRQCPNLKSLGLAEAQISSTALGQLGTYLSQLESFTFFYHRPNAAIQRSLADAVASMPYLKDVNVNGSFDGSYLLQLPDSVVNIVIGDTLGLEMANLAQFLHNHRGLKRIQMSTGYKKLQFWLGSDWVCDGTYEEKCRKAIGLLAQYCHQLEDLTFVNRLFEDKVSGDNRSFAEAFQSLTQLKAVEFKHFRDFNLAALESLCANCPNVEVLSMSIGRLENFGSAAEAFVHMAKLKKLKSLKMNLPIVDDGHTAALWGGIGASLEYLDVRGAEVTDASLLQIGLNCSCLAHLVMTKSHNSTFTTEGLIKNLIKKIVKHPSWNDPLKNRRLRIDVFYPRDAVGPDPMRTILDWYEGRVKINTIEYVVEI